MFMNGLQSSATIKPFGTYSIPPKIIFYSFEHHGILDISMFFMFTLTLLNEVDFFYKILFFKCRTK
jgi:hypothetical protein